MKRILHASLLVLGAQGLAQSTTVMSSFIEDLSVQLHTTKEALAPCMTSALPFDVDTLQWSSLVKYLHTSLLPSLLDCPSLTLLPEHKDALSNLSSITQLDSLGSFVGVLGSFLNQSPYVLDTFGDALLAHSIGNSVALGAKISQTISTIFLTPTALPDNNTFSKGLTKGLGFHYEGEPQCLEEAIQMSKKVLSLITTISTGGFNKKIRALAALRKIIKKDLKAWTKRCIRQNLSPQELAIWDNLVEVIESGDIYALFQLLEKNYERVSKLFLITINELRHQTQDNPEKYEQVGFLSGKALGYLLFTPQEFTIEPVGNELLHFHRGSSGSLTWSENSYFESENEFSLSTGSAISREDARDFTMNFLEAFSRDFTDVRECAGKMVQLSTSIKYVMELFQKKTLSEVLAAIKLLSDIVETEMIPGLVTCKTSEDDVLKILAAVFAMRNPKTFLFEISRRIVVNRVEIYHEVETAVNAYRKGDFSVVGYQVGLIFSGVLFGESPELSVAVMKGDMVLGDKRNGGKMESPNMTRYVFYAFGGIMVSAFLILSAAKFISKKKFSDREIAATAGATTGQQAPHNAALLI